MKRVSTSTTAEPVPKRFCLLESESGEPLITMHSLPSNMFHLGGENFATVSCFLGHTRIHVRKYTTDERGVLHPTKDGVSLTPAVWEALSVQLRPFLSFEGTTNVLIVKKDVCVSKQSVDGELFVSFQRMFQKKNHAFQFVPEHVLLTAEQVNQLDSYSDTLLSMTKEKLLSYTMDYFVQKQLDIPDVKSNGYSGDPDRPDGLFELRDDLCKCLKTFISSKITELFECFGCEVGYNNQLGHDCMTTSADVKFELYFDKALYALDWCEVAKHFVQDNINNVNFQRLVMVDDFFSVLDIAYVFENVKSLYVTDNS